MPNAHRGWLLTRRLTPVAHYTAIYLQLSIGILLTHGHTHTLSMGLLQQSTCWVFSCPAVQWMWSSVPRAPAHLTSANLESTAYRYIDCNTFCGHIISCKIAFWGQSGGCALLLHRSPGTSLERSSLNVMFYVADRQICSYSTESLCSVCVSRPPSPERWLQHNEGCWTLFCFSVLFLSVIHRKSG